MPDLTPQSPLMSVVEFDGQLYYTSQYFHRQYVATSQYGGKYKHHSNFLQVIRAMELYEDYVTLGHILLLTWHRVKSGGNEICISLKPLFQMTSYNPITLLNGTAQAELAHHLDDEASKQIAHAANKSVAKSPGAPLPMALAHETVQHMLAIAELFGTPKHVAIQSAIKQALIDTGVDLQSLAIGAPAMSAVDEDEKMLEPTDLAKLLSLPSGAWLNKALEHLGWQVHTNGTWKPTQSGQQYAVSNPWIKNGKTGYNIRWNVEAVRQVMGGKP